MLVPNEKDTMPHEWVINIYQFNYYLTALFFLTLSMKLEGFQHWITLAFLGVQEPSTYVHRSLQSKKKET